MTVKTADLQAISSLKNNLLNLNDETIEITIGPGLGRVWKIVGSTNGAPGEKILTLTPLSGGTEAPTDRSEFRVPRVDTRGRIIGFGMGPNVIVGGGVQPGGITYGDMEVTAGLTWAKAKILSGSITRPMPKTTPPNAPVTFTRSRCSIPAVDDDDVTVKLLDGEDGDFALNTPEAATTRLMPARPLSPLTIFGWDRQPTPSPAAAPTSRLRRRGPAWITSMAMGALSTRLGQSLPQSAFNPPITYNVSSTSPLPTCSRILRPASRLSAAG